MISTAYLNTDRDLDGSISIYVRFTNTRIDCPRLLFDLKPTETNLFRLIPSFPFDITAHRGCLSCVNMAIIK
jgi:hypothetical protein